MPPLTSTQLALLRSERHRSFHYLVPLLNTPLMTALVNDGAIAVGARVITYDGASGSYTNIKGGETLWIGSSAGAFDIGKARVISASSTQLTISENSDIAWADNLFLTIREEYLIWPKRHRIDGSGVKFVDYNVAYTDQTDKWPPVAMMGDPCVAFFTAGVTPDAAVYFDGSQSYAMAPGATISSYAWTFPGGSPASSAIAIPGIVTWNATGYYWCALTVTDSNGKTATTRRLIVVVDPTSTNVFNDFEIESCEVSIDGVLKAQFKVFGAATLATFKERSPVFWVRDDRYGDVHTSVGFPSGREHISLFGYIDERSVRKDPYTNEITFTLLNAAGVMQNASTYPVWCQDKATPSVWTDAKKLTIRRSLFYLLKFHSTVFEVADVELPNDTTPTRKADFPENNLWVQYDNFARVARGERTGVTKTGRLITRPDPQLLPTAQRNSLAVICQLQPQDWVTEVSWGETDWPNVSFLDLWGITYDANPAHESNPVHSMAPGNPYKDFGSQEQQQYMQLNGQTDGNALAGFMLGQKNWRYAPLRITLGGNWWNCIDPAWQEYIKAPTGGFPTKEDAAQLANARLIVRTIRMAHQWGTGAFNTEIECEVETATELGVTGPIPVDVSEPPAGCSAGDTYDPDTAACITPDPPPCSDISLSVSFNTVPAEVDRAVSGPAPLSVDFINLSTGADGYLWDFGDGSSSTASDPTHVFTTAGIFVAKLTGYTACISFTVQTTVIVAYEVDFTFTSPVNAGDTVTFTKNIAGGVVQEYLWQYGDGAILDDISGIDPTHVYNFPGTRNVTLTVTFEGGTKVSRTHPIVVLAGGGGSGTLGGMDVWVLYADGMIGHLTSLTPGAEVFTQLNEWKIAFAGGGITAYALSPAASPRVMLLSFGTGTFRFNKSSDDAVSWVQNDTTLDDFPGLVDIDRNNPDHAWAITDTDGSNIVHGWYTTNGGVSWTKITLWNNPADEGNLWLGAAMGGDFAYAMVVENASTNPKVHFMKVLSDGSFTTETFNMIGAWNYPASSSLQPNGGYVDPTDVNRVFLVASDIGGGSLVYTLFTLDWFAGTLSSQALPVLNAGFPDTAKTVIVTVMGTVLVFVEGATTYVMRSTNHGANWSTINLSVAYGNNLALRFAQVTEVGGTVSTTPGIIVVAMTLDGTDGGRFLFSQDDGVTWSRSPVIGYTGTNLESSGGVRSRT